MTNKVKTILIIGDSWGVPDYSTTAKPQHTEFFLKDLGYNVLNYSLNSGSMLETIEYARYGILNEPLPQYINIDYKRNTFAKQENLPKLIPKPNYCSQTIDWIVWFHTESIRELLPPILYPYTKLEEMHEFLLVPIYRAFVNLLNVCSNPKTAIIGGQASVDKKLYEFHKPNFIIEDWRSQIVGKQLPNCYTLSKLEIVDKSIDSRDAKIKIFDVHKLLYDAMINKEQFYDNIHPAAAPHRDLTNTLHKIFQGMPD